MSIRVSICYEEPQVFPLVELNQGERQSKIYFLLWRANCIGMDVLPPLETGSSSKKNKSDQIKWGSYKEALRVAHQRALDTAEALKSDIKRLNQRRRDRSQTRSQNQSQSRSLTRARSWSRSHSRAQNWNHSQSSTQNVHPMSPDGPPSGRRVTFRNPKVEMSSERDAKDYSTEPSVSDVETWLEWQAKQLGTPTWWMELQAIPGIRDPQKLAQKIRASFYIHEVRIRTLLEPGYTVPPTLRSLDRNAFLPDNLSYQDMQQKLALLMMAYARCLQYWAEK